MLSRIILSVIVAVVVTLGCYLVGTILVTLRVDIAIAVGGFLQSWGSVIGILSGLWYFFSGSTLFRR